MLETLPSPNVRTNPMSEKIRIGVLGASGYTGADLVRLAGRHFHDVINSDMHHTTSLARLTIFMKFRSRSSRATAPKMRVPRGFFSLSMITTALLSNRT